MVKPHKKVLKPTYNGIVAAYEVAGINSGSMWWDSAIGTRVNGIASGAPYNNWTGLPVSLIPPPTSVPPTFDGVDDACGTGQPYSGSITVGLDYIYQERAHGHVPEMELPTTGTLEAWFKPATVAGSRSVLAYHYLVRIGTKGSNHMIYLPSGQIALSATVNIGTWYHAVLTFTYGGTCDYWVDGTKLLAAQAMPAHTAQRAWFIGSDVNKSWPFGGEINTVRFYNRVLTDAEIARNYHSGLRFHS